MRSSHVMTPINSTEITVKCTWCKLYPIPGLCTNLLRLMSFLLDCGVHAIPDDSAYQASEPLSFLLSFVPFVSFDLLSFPLREEKAIILALRVGPPETHVQIIDFKCIISSKALNFCPMASPLPVNTNLFLHMTSGITSWHHQLSISWLQVNTQHQVCG